MHFIEEYLFNIEATLKENVTEVSNIISNESNNKKIEDL
jgi:hypothetical protein